MTNELSPSIDIGAFSLAAQMRSLAVPALLMVVAAFVWLKVCQRLRRRQDAEFDAHLAALDGAEQSIQVAMIARSHVGRGKPSERLYFAGLMLASMLALTCLFGLFLFR